MAASPILRVLTGPHSGEEIPLDLDRRLVLGRELSCDIVLEEPVLSRKHCAIECGEDGYTVTDLGSKNGTYLNGQRIASVGLEVGDVIRIGSTRLEFIVPRSEAEVAAENGEAKASEFYVRTSGLAEEEEEEKDPLVGGHVGSYFIHKKIGEGGMGSVYKVTDTRNHSEANEFALKLMNKALTLEEDQVARFKREFQAGQELGHPNIVQTLDFGSWDETFYLVMEYVEGHELQDILDIRGRLSPRGAIKVALQVALALEYAFRQKIIHGDIKPENILITPKGVVKLLDLGLAKKIKEETGGSSITKTGEGIGTLHYMAPEQTINARDTDQRSDIYALGATLYHMIAGQPPFEASGIWEFVELIQHGVPQPLTELASNVPEQLWETVKKSLEKHPRDRYQTPRDFRKALENCLQLV